jgi:AraC-like DNA-binding protein
MDHSHKQPMLTSRTLLLVEAFMNKHGRDFARAMRDVGLDPDVTHNRDAEVPLQSFVELLENVAGSWGTDAFGVLLAESYSFGMTGIFDHAIANSPTLEAALANYVRFYNLVVGGYELELKKGESRSYLTTTVPPFLGAHDQSVDGTLALQVIRIRHVMVDPTFPIAIDMMRRTPRAVDEFYRVLGPDVRFGRPQNRIGVATADLQRPVPIADSFLYELVEAAADKASHARRTADDAANRLAMYLGGALASGETSLDAAAEALGLTPRALARELRKAGTNYSEFVASVRKSMAEHYIRKSDLPLTEVAFLLGFSELSAFSRAAKGWFGTTAREMRKQLQH